MENDFIIEIQRMVNDQIIGRGIKDDRLIEAILSVPRHLFIPQDYISSAYSDGPVPIGYHQTISQPYIVALMISSLNLLGNEKILEVGTGCGYQTAIISHLAKTVISVELISDLAKGALKTLQHLNLKNISIKIGDGSQGWIEDAPYDAILISAAAPKVPVPLLEQLAEGGRLILPVGSRKIQQLETWKRIDSKFIMNEGIPVSFVPLRGKFGFAD